MHRRFIKLLLSVMVFLVSAIMLISGSSMLSIAILNEPLLPIGTISTGTGIVALSCIFFYAIKGFHPPKTFFMSVYRLISQFTILAALSWGMVSYLLAGNWTYSFSSQSASFVGSTAAYGFFIRFTFFVIALPLVLAIVFAMHFTVRRFMQNKRRKTLYAIAILISSNFILASCHSPDQQKPNIIFILVDDLGWTDLGCYGSTFHETPNIDRLASQSILFSDAYAACPVCSPTRAAIMTGKYPTRLNITDWIPGDDPKNRKLLGTLDNNKLALEEVTLAEALRAEGYHTFFAGKWHLGDKGFFPEDQGFDINKGGHHRGSPPGGYYVPYKNPMLEDGPDGEYLTDRLTDESIKFIKKNQENPFLLFLSFYTVHTPIQANSVYVDYYQQKFDKLGIPGTPTVPEHTAYTTVLQANPDYASMVHAMDVNIGRLIHTLEDLDLDQNTVVIFTSDNGGLSTITNPDWIAPTSVKPLRAGKGWCYEGGIRIPLLVHIPGSPAFESDMPVISMDLYPTILGLAHAEIPADIDGKSLMPLIEMTGSFNRDAIFWHYPHYHSSGWTPGAAIRAGKWKLIEFYDLEKVELYDLEKDVGETNDLSANYPDTVEQLKDKLRKFQLDTKVQFPAINQLILHE